jgi:type IV fimbrial biogenesis protein FimT
MRIERHGSGISKHGGLSILELMITLSIAAILLVTGIPSFQQYSLKQHIKAATASLHNDLRMARSEAVHKNTSVVACPGNPGGGCSDSNDWSAGWIVFNDSNRDRQRQPGEPLLRHSPGFKNMKIHSPISRTAIRFYPNGSAPGSNTSISLCGLGGPEMARKLVISNIGRIRRDTFPTLDPGHCPAI